MREGNRRQFSVTRVRKEKRTVPVPAQGAEEGRYFKCWNCGFICDIQKNALDTGRAGNSHTPATLTPGREVGDLASVRFRVGRPIVLRALNSIGEHKPIYVQRSVTVSSGCPFCGTHAWKD